MLCPVCQQTLQMMERQGVEIDYCPKCRGVWLDRGELEKIIERSATFAGPPPVAGPPPGMEPSGGRYAQHDERREYRDDYRDRRDYDDDDDRYGRRKKRKSWFGEMFDFD